MPATTYLYDQVLPLLRQYTCPRDLRHLKALAWMVTALVCSGRLSLPKWEAYVPSRARQAQSSERRWQRFMRNRRVQVKSLYVPLVLAAMSRWRGASAISGSRYHGAVESLLHDSPVSDLLWAGSALAVAGLGTSQCHCQYREVFPYAAVSTSAVTILPNVMVLADRGFANHQLLAWLSQSHWHYCLRLPSDVVVHGPLVIS